MSYYDNNNSSRNNNNGWNRQRDDYSQKDSYNSFDTSRYHRKEFLSNFEKNFLDFIDLDKNKNCADFYRKHEMEIKNINLPPANEFHNLRLGEKILQYFKSMGYEHPTPIQAQGWPVALSGTDLVGIAQTGSGKSLSFILPALIHISENKKNNKNCIALVLAPTRELCLQINEVANSLAYFFSINSIAIYGGASKYTQMMNIRKGVDFISATPGRLLDLINENVIPMENITYLVLDEADRMLDMGFEQQLKSIASFLMPERQTTMWSATWPREVQDLAKEYLKNDRYAQIRIGGNELVGNIKIEQRIFHINENEKLSNLMEFLNSHKDEKMIIFCNKKRTCDYLEYEVNRGPIKALAIHGDKSQDKRDKIISDFKKGRVTCLIATDVAARGLDVPDIKVVLNYDMATSCEQYVHRIGRTGRGKNSGVAYTYFTEENTGCARELIGILKKGNQKVPPFLEQMGRNHRSSNSNYNAGRRRRW